MKRMYLGLLLLVAAGILACGTPSTNNGSAPTPAATPGASPTLGKSSSGDDPFKDVEVLVTITISDDGKAPLIESVLPESADLSGGKRVQWVVVNNSQQPAAQNATVVIGPFSGKANPVSNKPFGPDACANMFTLDFLKEGLQSREISEQEKFQAGEEGYTYEVTLKGENGDVLSRYKKVPEIIVGGMAIKPGATPKATPKASPKPSSTAKPKT